jgi:hypothetical protein
MVVHRRRLVVLAVAVLLGAQPRIAAGGMKMFGGGTGSWTDDGQWQPPGEPQAGDDVVISGGSVELDADTEIATLTLSGGTLTGTGTLTVSGLITWTAGTMSGTGTTVAIAGMALGGSGKFLDRRTVLLAGGTATMDASHSSINMENGATFTNQSLFTLSNDGGLTTSQGFFDAGGSGAFNNQGTLRKLTTGNSGASRFGGVAFNNSGTVEVQAGGLALAGGGTHVGATFTATTPGVVDFDGGTHMLDAACILNGTGTVDFSGGTTTHPGTYQVSGPTQVSGGEVLFSGTVSAVGDLRVSSGTADFSSASAQISVASLEQSGGTLTGSNTLVVAGPASWTSGTMSGSGTTLLMDGLGLGGTSKTLNQRTLVLSGGTAAMNTNVSFISMRNGATFTNQGTVELSNDGGLGNNQGFFDGGSGSGAFNNHGTLRKLATGNSGTSRFSGIAVTNTGVVDVQAAVLSFSGGFTQTAGTTRLSGGTLASATPLMINGGTLKGSGTVQGDVSNSGIVAPGPAAATLQIAGAYTQTVDGTLSVELGGAAAAQFDRLEVSGSATLAGALDVSLLDGFQPALGQQFEVMTFASRSGTIPTFAGLDVGHGLALQPLQGDSDLVLQVVGGSGNPTPTPAGSMSPTGAPTAGASPTPTATAMPGGVTIGGRVLIPGPSGLIAGQSLAVDVFACATRRDCLATPSAALAHAVTGSDGTFTVEIAGDLVPPDTLLVLDASTGDVSCRQLITPPTLTTLTPGTQLTIDPISEAAVRLLDAAGMENYSDDAIDAVIAAVRTANADTNFDGLTADQAKDAAGQAAAGDPAVQMVRVDNLRSCVGDCDGDHSVQIQELILAVRIADGEVPVSSCKEIDANLDGVVAVNELVAAVNRALSGCS